MGQSARRAEYNPHVALALVPGASHKRPGFTRHHKCPLVGLHGGWGAWGQNQLQAKI